MCSGTGRDYLAEAKTRSVTETGFHPAAHGPGTSDVAMNGNRPCTPYAEGCRWRRSGLAAGWEKHAVVGGGRSLQIEFWWDGGGPSRARRAHVRNERAGARDGSRNPREASWTTASQREYKARRLCDCIGIIGIIGISNDASIWA
jgi:hypothetical protein